MSAVIAVPLCPKRSLTRFKSTPCAIKIEADEWRRSCNRNAPIAARFTIVPKRQPNVAGGHMPPSSRAKIKSRFS